MHGQLIQVIQDSERHDREQGRGCVTMVIAAVIEGSFWCIFVTAQAWTCGPTKMQHQITGLQHVPSHVWVCILYLPLQAHYRKDKDMMSMCIQRVLTVIFDKDCLGGCSQTALWIRIATSSTQWSTSTVLFESAKRDKEGSTRAFTSFIW